LIVVNATFKIAPWADVLYAADHRFWETYRRAIFNTFEGEMWSVSEQSREKYGVYWIRHGRGQGFCAEPDTINGGGHSGFQAVHLAATFGAKRIILLGFDLQRTDGKLHWHGKHEGGLPNGNGFAGWIRSMGYLGKDLAARGVEIINCSRKTALRCFPRVELENAFVDCAYSVKHEGSAHAQVANATRVSQLDLGVDAR
jgi:hypothetical protein